MLQQRVARAERGLSTWRKYQVAAFWLGRGRDSRGRWISERASLSLVVRERRSSVAISHPTIYIVFPPWLLSTFPVRSLRCGPSDHGMINEALKGSDRTCSLRGPVNPHCPIYCMKLFSLFLLLLLYYLYYRDDNDDDDDDDDDDNT